MSRTPWASSATKEQSYELGGPANAITVGVCDKSSAVTGGHKGNSWDILVEAFVDGAWLSLGTTRTNDTALRARPVLVACLPGASNWRIGVRYTGSATTTPVEATVHLAGAPCCTTPGLVAL